MTASRTYTFNLEGGLTCVMAGWTHARAYARGMVRNATLPVPATATVSGLVPGRKYEYQVYQYSEQFGGTNGLLVNGDANSYRNTTSSTSLSPTAHGAVKSTPEGTIVFEFVRKAVEVHVSAVAILEYPRLVNVMGVDVDMPATAVRVVTGVQTIVAASVATTTAVAVATAAGGAAAAATTSATSAAAGGGGGALTMIGALQFLPLLAMSDGNLSPAYRDFAAAMSVFSLQIECPIEDWIFGKPDLGEVSSGAQADEGGRVVSSTFSFGSATAATTTLKPGITMEASLVRIGVVRITLVANSSTWLAFGVPAASGSATDVIACGANGPTALRFWVSTPSAPLRGGVPVSGSNCSRTGGSTVLSFERSAAAAGARQAPITLGAPQQIVWSIGDEGDSTLSSLEGPPAGTTRQPTAGPTLTPTSKATKAPTLKGKRRKAGGKRRLAGSKGGGKGGKEGGADDAGEEADDDTKLSGAQEYLNSKNTTAEKLLYGNVFWYFALMLTAVIVNLLMSILGYMCHHRKGVAWETPTKFTVAKLLFLVSLFFHLGLVQSGVIALAVPCPWYTRVLAVCCLGIVVGTWLYVFKIVRMYVGTAPLVSTGETEEYAEQGSRCGRCCPCVRWCKRKLHPTEEWAVHDDHADAPSKEAEGERFLELYPDMFEGTGRAWWALSFLLLLQQACFALFLTVDVGLLKTWFYVLTQTALVVVYVGLFGRVFAPDKWTGVITCTIAVSEWGAVVAETFMTDPTVPMFICNLLGCTVGAVFEFYEKLDVMIVLVLTLWTTFRQGAGPSIQQGDKSPRDSYSLSSGEEEEGAEDFWNPLAISPPKVVIKAAPIMDDAPPPPEEPRLVQQEQRRKAKAKRQHAMVATFVGKLVEHGLTTDNVTEVFAVFDDDGGGSICEEEFREGLHTLSLLWPRFHLDEHQVRTLIAALDDSGDGVIDFGEMVAHVRRHLLEQQAARKEDTIWTSRVDKKSGRTYYVNPATRQRTWHKPPTLHEDDHAHGHEDSRPGQHQHQAHSHSPAQTRRPRAAPSLHAEPESAGGEWNTRTDKKSGRTYYTNKITRERTWRKPAELAAAELAGADGRPRRRRALPAMEEPEATTEWAQRTDKKSGRTYYVNAATKERQWRKPPAMAAEQEERTRGREDTAMREWDSASTDVVRKFAAHLTQQGLEASTVAKVFSVFADSDGSGGIGPEEFTRALATLDVSLGPQDVQTLAAALDDNGDGQIDVRELVRHVEAASAGGGVAAAPAVRTEAGTPRGHGQTVHRRQPTLDDDTHASPPPRQQRSAAGGGRSYYRSSSAGQQPRSPQRRKPPVL